MAKKTFKIYKEKDAVYREPNFWDNLISKSLHLIMAGIITWFLFKQLNNQDANPIVLIYFSILGLTCFEVIGLPISKLSNILSSLKG